MLKYILDSERSDESIDFTMMCVCVFIFSFVSEYTITCQNNDSISNFRGGYRWQNEYSRCFLEVKSKKSIF